jgi:hypothetical protein
MRIELAMQVACTSVIRVAMMAISEAPFGPKEDYRVAKVGICS